MTLTFHSQIVNCLKILNKILKYSKNLILILMRVYSPTPPQCFNGSSRQGLPRWIAFTFLFSVRKISLRFAALDCFHLSLLSSEAGRLILTETLQTSEVIILGRMPIPHKSPARPYGELSVDSSPCTGWRLVGDCQFN